MASHKQVQYALSLLHGAGYGTKYMSSAYKDFGATMAERRGRVEDWLRGKTMSELSELIDRLKSMQPYRTAADKEVTALKDAAGPDADVAELRKIAGLE